jgi:ABC-type transporter Mla maintaining outer membrane lipid asymmetry permease subunit MlaE
MAMNSAARNLLVVLAALVLCACAGAYVAGDVGAHRDRQSDTARP